MPAADIVHHAGKCSRHVVSRATHEGVSWLLRQPVEALVVARHVGERLLADGEAEAAALIDFTVTASAAPSGS